MENIGGLFKKISAFFLSLIMTIAGLVALPGQPKEEPTVVTKQDYCFDNDRLIIGAYCFNENDETEKLVRYAKEAGIEFFIAGAYEEYLDLLDENDMGLIATNYNEYASYFYWQTDLNILDKWKLLNEENYNYSHKCIWGDNMVDEPHASLFPAMGEAVDAYYANTTGKLPYINLFPIYATGDQLGNYSDINEKVFGTMNTIDSLNISVDQYKQHVEQYVENISTDYICVDIYPLNKKESETGEVTKETYGLWLRNLDILATACRETGRDLWVITQAAGLGSGHSPRYADTPEDIRWQAYVSLAFGTKALIHACYYGGWWDDASHLIDDNFNRTDTYYAVQTVDRELAAFADIYGNYISKGAFLENGYKAAGNLTGYLALVEDFKKPAKVTNDPVLIGCFEEKNGEGTAYSIVNMYEPETEKEAEITLQFPNTESITLYRKGEITEISGNKLKLTLENCEGVFVTAK